MVGALYVLALFVGIFAAVAWIGKNAGFRTFMVNFVWFPFFIGFAIYGLFILLAFVRGFVGSFPDGVAILDVLRYGWLQCTIIVLAAIVEYHLIIYIPNMLRKVKAGDEAVPLLFGTTAAWRGELHAGLVITLGKFKFFKWTLVLEDLVMVSIRRFRSADFLRDNLGMNSAQIDTELTTEWMPTLGMPGNNSDFSQGGAAMRVLLDEEGQAYDSVVVATTLNPAMRDKPALAIHDRVEGAIRELFAMILYDDARLGFHAWLLIWSNRRRLGRDLRAMRRANPEWTPAEVWDQVYDNYIDAQAIPEPAGVYDGNSFSQELATEWVEKCPDSLQAEIHRIGHFLLMLNIQAVHEKPEVLNQRDAATSAALKSGQMKSEAQAKALGWLGQASMMLTARPFTQYEKELVMLEEKSMIPPGLSTQEAERRDFILDHVRACAVKADEIRLQELHAGVLSKSNATLYGKTIHDLMESLVSRRP